MRPLNSRRNSRMSFRSQAKSATSRAGVSHGAMASISEQPSTGAWCQSRSRAAGPGGKALGRDVSIAASRYAAV